MPKTINVKGFGVVSFPDTMSDGDIQKALQTNPAFKAQQAQAPMQQVPVQQNPRTIGEALYPPEVNSQLTQLKQSAQKLQRGSTVGGLAQAGNAELNLVASPISILARKALEVTNNNPQVQAGIDILSAIPKATGWVGENLAKAGLGYAGAILGHNLGTSPANAGDIYQQVPKLAGTVGSIVGIPESVRGGKAIAEKSPFTPENKIARSQAEIKKVAPPRPNELNYDQLVKKATPYIAQQVKETPFDPKSGVSEIRQATDIVANAKNNLWENKIAPVVEKYGDQTIDGSQIANSIREGLTDYTKNHDPLAAKRIEAYAQSFDGKQIPISQASRYITELNARTSAYQKAPGIQKTLIENASPNIGSEVNAVNALRDAVYGKLDELGAPEVRGLKQDYGALAQVHKALERNITRVEKGSSSSSFYSKPFGTGVMTGATLEGFAHHPSVTSAAVATGVIKKFLIDRNKPNPMIERSFKRLSKTIK